MNKENQIIIAAKKYLLKDDEYSEYNRYPQSLYSNNFKIPAYQRPYSWQKANIDQLLKDFYDQFSKRNSNDGRNNFNNDYYVGSITCTPNKISGDDKAKLIIDGQQRITSIYLIFIWFKNELNSYSCEYLNKKINLFKLKMSEPDNEVLRQLLLQKTNKKILNFFSQTKLAKTKGTFYYKQFLIFRTVFKRINLFLSNKEFFDNHDKLEDFYKFIGEHVFCLFIEDNPTTQIGDYLFLALNGKGLKLDKIDLIKSYFVGPYMGCVNDIEKFKKMWAQIINDSENQLKNFITGYFKKNSTKQISGNWVFAIQQMIKKSETPIKKEFESMCKWIGAMKPANKLETGSVKVDFWLSLFKVFKYQAFFPVYGHIRSKFTTEEQFKNNQTKLAEILSLIFKLNFLYLTFNHGKAQEFIQTIINPSLDIISDYENKPLDMISNLKIFLISKFKEYAEKNIDNYNKIIGFNPMNYSYARDKNFIRILNLFLPGEDNDSYDDRNEQIIFEHAKEKLLNKRTLDHILHQKQQKYYDGEDDSCERLTLYLYDKKRKIFENNVPQEVLDHCGINDSSNYEEFKEKFLDKPFNLRVMGASANPQRGDRDIFYKSDIKKILNVEWIESRNNKYKIAFQRLIGIKKTLGNSVSINVDNIISLIKKLILKKRKNILENKTKLFWKFIKGIEVNEINFETVMNESLGRGQIITIANDLFFIDRKEKKFLFALIDGKNSDGHCTNFNNLQISKDDKRILNKINKKLEELYNNA